jgi:hypothetical protein
VVTCAQGVGGLAFRRIWETSWQGELLLRWVPFAGRAQDGQRASDGPRAAKAIREKGLARAPPEPR